MPGVDERSNGGEDVRRAGQQQTDDVTVAKAANDAGEEVGEAVGGADTDVEGDEENHLPVENGHLEAFPYTGFGFGG